MTETAQTQQAAATIAETSLHTEGQRRINLLWEITQAIIALATTAKIVISISPSTVVVNAFFLIIGFYFGRTNHQRIGGVEQGR